jgi:hypothetical protein
VSTKVLTLAGIIAVLIHGEAFAESCNIQSTRPPGEWKFVRVYDADTGAIVLRQAINGGVNKQVVVSGERVRVDSKLPGDMDYRTGAVALCKGGNIVKV